MRLTIPSALLALTVLAGDATPARAQAPPADPPGLADKSLEDLMSVEVGTVFGAARREQRVTEAPSSVTIVTAEDIRTFGWRTLAEALSSVRGFYVTNDRNYTYVGVRGFGRPSDYNNRVLVLVNGHRYNDNVYDQALIGHEFPIDLSLVDRIEVIRGPGSALYGTSAFFAVINLVLRPGGAVGGSESTIEVGSFDTYRPRTSYGRRSASGVDSLLSVSHLSSDGQSLLYFPEYDQPELQLRRQPPRRPRIVDERVRVGRPRPAVGAGGVRQPPEGGADRFIRNHAGRQQLHRRLTRLDRRDGHRLVQGRGAERPRLRRLQRLRRHLRLSRRHAQHRHRRRRLGGHRRHRVQAGRGSPSGDDGRRSTRRNVRQDQDSHYVDPFLSNVDSHYRSNQGAVYAQDEIQLHRRLTATVGGRYDWWSLTGGTVTPRVGLVYRTDADTAIKALFGEAYRAPTVYETYYYPDPFGRTLRPERLRTSEVVYEQYFGGTLRFTATGYVTQAKNLISQGAEYYFENREQARSRGIEVEAEHRWTSGILLRGSYVAQRTMDPIANVELSNSPRRQALVHAAAPMWSRKLSLAAESQYVGHRFSTMGTHIDGVWLTNVNVTFVPPRRPLSFAARVSNVFDTPYAHPVGYEFRQDLMPQDGRSVSVRATLRF